MARQDARPAPRSLPLQVARPLLRMPAQPLAQHDEEPAARRRRLQQRRRWQRRPPAPGVPRLQRLDKSAMMIHGTDRCRLAPLASQQRLASPLAEEWAPRPGPRTVPRGSLPRVEQLAARGLPLRMEQTVIRTTPPRRRRRLPSGPVEQRHDVSGTRIPGTVRSRLARLATLLRLAPLAVVVATAPLTEGGVPPLPTDVRTVADNPPLGIRSGGRTTTTVHGTERRPGPRRAAHRLLPRLLHRFGGLPRPEVRRRCNSGVRWSRNLALCTVELRLLCGAVWMAARLARCRLAAGSSEIAEEVPALRLDRRCLARRYSSVLAQTPARLGDQRLR